MAVLGYESKGHGETVILIPGLGYGRWLWEKQILELAERFRVIAIDNRGIGDSEMPPGPYSISEMAEDVRELMERLKISSAHVVGASLGGFIAQELSLKYPEKVNKLVLACTTGGGKGSKNASLLTMLHLFLAGLKKDPIQKSKAMLKATVAPAFFSKHPEIIEDIIKKFLNQKSSPHGVQAQKEAGQKFWKEENRWYDLPSIRNQTLIIAGSEDKIVPPANSEMLQKQIPGAKKVIINGAGHLLMIEKPDEFNKQLLEFLL